jgi:DTW domain-containing protein YfiP
MKIFLLTHERELDRKTNTGNIAIKATKEFVERIIWDRVNPNKKLLKMIEKNEVTLLYPDKEAKPFSIDNFKNVIIIDATWQEARKIYNKSPYLKATNKTILNSKNTSQYNLRRNQPKGGLCTVECIIELLKTTGENELANKLSEKFKSFNFPNNKENRHSHKTLRSYE